MKFKTTIKIELSFRVFIVWLLMLLNTVFSQVNEIESKYTKYFKTAEEFAKKLGFKLDKSKIKIFIQKDSIGTGTVIRFKNKEVSIRVDKQLNKVVGYFNYKAFHTHNKIVENDNPEKKIKLNLTKEEVVNIAKKFIEEILEEDVSGYYPKITFPKVVDSSSKGEWWIVFYKTYKGFILKNCWFNLCISDPLKKVIGFARKVSRERISPPKIKISEEEAIKKAREVAIIYYNLCRKHGGFWELGKVFSVKKEIATPSSILPTSKKEWKEIEKKGMMAYLKRKIRHSNKPRLVYIIIFERISRSLYEFNPYGIQIWIDAKTGEVVGGDEYL